MVALLIVALFASNGTDREQFGAAIRLSASGEHDRAAQMLVELADSQPDSSLADDALMKAAQIYEEQLARPARAAELYQRVIDRYPQVRAARRAKRRLAVLQRGLGDDNQWSKVLGQYQAILSDYARGDRMPALAAMIELVNANPEFPLAGEGRLWIASGYRIEGRLDKALTWYKRARAGVVDAASGGGAGATIDLAWRADKALADLAVLRGDYEQAEDLYRSLATDTPVRKQVVDASLSKVAVMRARARWALVGWAVIALFLVAMGLVLFRAAGSPHLAWRALARPPTELIFFAPVAAIWTVIALTSNAIVARATVYILLGGFGVTWLSGAAISEARKRGPTPRTRRIAHATLAAAAIIAICYIALANERLLDLIGETVKFGHEGH